MHEIWLIENIKNILISIWSWIVAWWCGWAIAELYVWIKRGKFRISNLIVSTAMWCFAWYITSWFTNNWALAWLAWALSMKIFDFINTNSEQLITQYLEKKMWINIKK